MARSGMVAVLALGAAAVAQDRPRSVVVMPFTIEGASADSVALRAGADRLVQELNKVLWADSTVRWLVYRTRQRPQDPRTGAVVAARYGVIGGVRAGPADSLRVGFHLVAVETMDLVVRDSVAGVAGQEAALVQPMARRLVTALHADAGRPRVARADSIPIEAVTLVTRATELANHGDTAAAVAALRQVIVIAPRWTVPCVMLRQLRPGEPCP